MSNAILQRTTRATRAANIATNGGIVQLASGGTVVVDVATGSAFGHLASADSCDCADRRFRGVVCKHMLSLRAAEGRECCPQCGAYRVEKVYYIGGRGYVAFADCSANSQHQARRID